MRKLFDPTGLIALAYDIMFYFVPLELLPLTGMNPVPVQIVSVALCLLAYNPILDWIYQLKERYGKKVLWILLIVFILLSALFLWRFNETESVSGYLKELVKEGLLYCIIPDLILYFYHVMKLNRTSSEAVKTFGSGSKGLESATTGETEPTKAADVVCGANRPIEGDYDPSLAAVCTNGTFVGSCRGHVLSFLGIPYACPPVGPLRWKAPQRAKDDSGVYEATSYGKAPIQLPIKIMGIAPEDMDEDCLTLNIWKNTRAPRDSLLPVLVFLNSIDFICGGTQNPYYDGDMFVKNHPDVLFVNVNFRLGIFGNLDLSPLPGSETAYPDSTCLTLLDQIEALKWIRENIEAFGGDSENVTVAGSMSGAVSTLLLTQMPEGRGLFHRAMILGGEWTELIPRKISHRATRELLEYLGVHTLQELEALPVSLLLQAEEVFQDSSCLRPVLDGKHLPLHPFSQFQKDAAPDVNLVFFTNEDEPYAVAMCFGGPEANKSSFERVLQLLSDNREFIETFRNFYESRKAVLCNPTRAYLQTVGCLFCTAPYFHACRSQALHGGKARMLLWRLDSAVEEFRSNSLLQTAFFLGKVEESLQFGITGDNCYSQILMQMTVNFMKCGNPSIREGQIRNIDPMDWPRFTRKESPIMILDENGYSLDTGEFEKQISMLNNLAGIYSEPDI